jgi:hypothetical protein
MSVLIPISEEKDLHVRDTIVQFIIEDQISSSKFWGQGSSTESTRGVRADLVR